jgi:hypothetical protein
MLRKVLLVLVVIFPVLVSMASWNTVDDREKDSFDITHDEVGESLDYPVNVALGDSDVAYALITESAQAAGVNVIKKVKHSAIDGTVSFVYFVYLTNDDSYLNTVFPLKTGRFLSTNDQDPEQAYLSTVTFSDPNQIGVIKEFGGNDIVKVFEFKKYLSLYAPDGYYYIECSVSEYCELFFETLSNKINYLGVYSQPEWLNPDYGGVGITLSDDIPPQVLIYLALFLILILVFYCIFNEYKTIGILRLQGRSSTTVLLNKFVAPFTVTYFSGSVVISLIWLIFGKTTDEFWLDFAYQLMVGFSWIVLICLLTLPFLYALNIPTVVKGRKGTGLILIVNAASKLIIGVLLMILTVNTVGAWLNYLEEEARLKRVAQWTDYGVFKTIIGTQTSDWMMDDQEIKTEVLQLCPFLESEGGLYVDSQNFLPWQQLNDTDFGGVKTLTVNPKYLQRYPAYDGSGDRIFIDNSETDWVVLVPISYQDQENLIRSTYQRLRYTALQEADYFEANDLERLTNQEVKIIWTANGQNYFTYNSYINSVIDPIIQVMTQSNSLGDDRLNAFRGGIDSALKIYLGDDSGDSVLAKLQPVLSELKLYDNFVSLLSFPEYSEYLINDNISHIENWGIRTGILILVLVLLIVQSAAINYERESRWIAIAKMQGYKFWDRYTKPISYFAMTWFMIAGALIVIYFTPGIDFDVGSSRFRERLLPVVSQYNRFLSADPMLILGIVATFVLLDVLITTLALKLIESKRVVTTLKGET